MRVVLDTNVLLSAVMKRETPPARLYQAWREGRFVLLTCETQLDEIRDVSRHAQVRARLRPARVGSLVNELRQLATVLEPEDGITVSEDPHDDFLLGLAVAGQADYLVTGDKRGLLAIRSFSRTRIVTASALAATITRT